MNAPPDHKSDRRTISLSTRLTACIALVAFGGFMTASAVLFLGARHMLRESLDSSLLTLARTETSSALDGPKGRIHVHENPQDAPSRIPWVAKLTQIQDVNGRILARTANLLVEPLPPVSPARSPDEILFADITHGGQPFRAVYYPMRGPSGEQLTAVVALSKHDLLQSQGALWAVLALFLGIGAGATWWVSSYLARKLTWPMERIANAAREVETGNLSARIPDNHADIECRDVARTLNDMLARLESAFQEKENLVASQRRFIADASHEMRSPLANLRGTVEVTLRRPRSQEEYRETLLDCRTEVERLCRLVEDLLTLSRVDAGQFALDTVPCDLARIAQQSSTACTARARHEQVRICVEAEELVPIWGDTDRLRQVIDNLIDNALRHAPPNTPVTVRVWRDGEHASVSVRDSGPGMSAEDQAHVFDRFYRADLSRTRQSGGMGLGLAIASAIVDAHKGNLSVQSEVNKGATFTVTLPIMKLNED